MTMTHYADAQGKYLGAFDELSEKPDGAVVPQPPHGNAIWTGEQWDDNAATRLERESDRRAAYEREADPIFFMAQRGEATMEEWQAKVAEIKARYPYPAE